MPLVTRLELRGALVLGAHASRVPVRQRGVLGSLKSLNVRVGDGHAGTRAVPGPVLV